MENFFLNSGMSWTLSKLGPYVIFLILGIVLFWFIRNRIKSKLMRRFALILIVAPVGIYLAVNPIYEGDFTNNVRVESKKGLNQFKEKRLSVLAIPNCPYCMGTIARLKKYTERTGDKVDFIVLSSNPDLMKDYRTASKGSKINVKLAKKDLLQSLSVLAKGNFPAFVFQKKKKLHVWNNDGFGVRALDWVESN